MFRIGMHAGLLYTEHAWHMACACGHLSLYSLCCVKLQFLRQVHTNMSTATIALTPTPALTADCIRLSWHRARIITAGLSHPQRYLSPLSVFFSPGNSCERGCHMTSQLANLRMCSQYWIVTVCSEHHCLVLIGSCS